MRKCAPGGSECVLTFKPVTLIDASGLDEAQVMHSGTYVPRVDNQVDALFGCLLALCFVLVRCLWGLRSPCRCAFFTFRSPDFFRVSQLSHLFLCTLYNWIRDRWQLP